MKNYSLICYLRNQGKFLPAWEEFKEFYYKIDKSDLSREEIIELWKFKQYLRFWLLGKKLKRDPLILNSYKNTIFLRAWNLLISNNLLDFFSHIIFGHTHIPGVYKPLFSNANTTTFPVLVNTGTWQQGEYRPHITQLSATSGIKIYPV